MKTKQQAEATPASGQHTPWTPGPWSTEKRLTTEITIRAADKTVIGGARCDSYLPAYEAEANATLIASAPALLEALKKCKAAVENGNLPPSARMELVRDYATPIINQAEGRVAE